MACVDRDDQLCRYYNLRLKCRKYYKYIFWFIVDVSITNAHILYYTVVIVYQRLKQFRLQLAQSLIGDYYGCQRIGGPSTSSVPLRQPIPHQPSYFPSKRSQIFLFLFDRRVNDIRVIRVSHALARNCIITDPKELKGSLRLKCACVIHMGFAKVAT